DPHDPTGCRNKQQLLDACETAVRRLAYDRRYFARPARFLFNEVRCNFAIGDQRHAWCVIERNMGLAQQFLEMLPEELILEGPRECRAHTRRGTPCQREPLPGRDYCPSHKHLEETFESVELSVDEVAGQRELDRVKAAA